VPLKMGGTRTGCFFTTAIILSEILVEAAREGAKLALAETHDIVPRLINRENVLLIGLNEVQRIMGGGRARLFEIRAADGPFPQVGNYPQNASAKMEAHGS